jgi:hypothetical protein
MSDRSDMLVNFGIPRVHLSRNAQKCRLCRTGTGLSSSSEGNHQWVFFSAADRATYLRLLKQSPTPDESRSPRARLGQIDSLEVLLRRVHGRYAQMVNTMRLRSGHLWQNRYFSCPLSESYLRRVLQYVERNPVRAGLVAQAEQIPRLSF